MQTVLKTEESSKDKDFIFRKGISSDVFDSSKDEENLKGKIFSLNRLRHLVGYLNFQSVLTWYCILGKTDYNNTKDAKEIKNKKETDEEFSKIYGNDSCNLDYTEEEFMKEFKDEEVDEEQNYENDPR